MLVEVTSVQPRDGYCLHLAFSDGLEGDVDLERELWGPMFEPLLDMDLFRRVRVDPALGTITWPNEADFAPEFLHEAVLAAGSGAVALH